MSENMTGGPRALNVSKGKMWAILISLMASTMMPCMAAVGRGTLLPTAMAELNAMQYYALIAAVGSLAMSITLPIGGKLGDLFGRRRLMIISQLGFIVSMAVICLASNVAMLAVGIFLSGMAYGFLSSSVRALVGEICPPEIRPTFIGISTSFEYGGMLFGPILAGLFCDIGYWKGLYAVCIPVMLVVTLILIVSLPKSVDHIQTGVRVDVKGIIALVMFLGSFLIVLNTTGSLIDYGSPLFWGFIAAAVIGLLLLIVWESKNEDAIVPVRLLKNGSYLRVWIVVFSLMFSYVITVYYSLYIQNIQGLSATMSGTLLMPQGIMNICMGTVIGWLLSRTGKYKAILVAEALINVGYCALFATFSANTPIILFEAATILFSIGYGGAITIGISLAQDSVSRKDWGIASSLMLLVDPLSYAIAASVSSPLMNRAWSGAAGLIPNTLKEALASEQLAALLNQATYRSAEALEAIRSSLSGELTGVFDTTVATLRDQMMAGIRSVCLMCLALGVVALLVALTLKEKKQDIKAES